MCFIEVLGSVFFLLSMLQSMLPYLSMLFCFTCIQEETEVGQDFDLGGNSEKALEGLEYIQRAGFG